MRRRIKGTSPGTATVLETNPTSPTPPPRSETEREGETLLTKPPQKHHKGSTSFCEHRAYTTIQACVFVTSSPLIPVIIQQQVPSARVSSTHSKGEQFQ